MTKTLTEDSSKKWKKKWKEKKTTLFFQSEEINQAVYDYQEKISKEISDEISQQASDEISRRIPEEINQWFENYYNL